MLRRHDRFACTCRLRAVAELRTNDLRLLFHVAFLVLGPAGRDWAVKRIVFQVARECACQILYQLCEKPIALSSSLFTAAITDSPPDDAHIATYADTIEFRPQREMRRKHREALWIFGADTAAITTRPWQRPIRQVKDLQDHCPFGPGSGTDILARALAAVGRGSRTQGIRRKQARSGVRHRHGGSQEFACRRVHDRGGEQFDQVLNPLMLPQLQYDPVADFIPLVGIVKYSMVMNAGPTLPFKSVRELVEAARSNPGKYTFASATTSTRAAMEVFERQAVSSSCKFHTSRWQMQLPH